MESVGAGVDEVRDVGEEEVSEGDRESPDGDCAAEDTVSVLMAAGDELCGGKGEEDEATAEETDSI